MIRIKHYVLAALVALSLLNGGLLIATTVGPQIRLAFSQEAPTQAPQPSWTRQGRWLGPIAGSRGASIGREST
jgi:hypothetical protein